MASELVQVAVGALSVIDRGRVDGTEVRDVAPTAMLTALEPALARTPDHLRWMEGKVGRYPFDTYGVLAADQQFFYALETQTLSLHPAFFLQAPVPPAAYEPIMVHELAHQWFGDSVAPVRWQDVWLNEGHADWYQREYDEQFFGVSLVDYMHDAYLRANQLRHDFGPVAKPTGSDIFTLFSDNGTRAARSRCTPCARSWAIPRSARSSAAGSSATRTSRSARRTSSPSRRTSRTAT